MTLKFTPPKEMARYALFVDHGNGRGFFKTYDDVGYAKVALRHRNYSMRNDAKILELVDGEWYVLFNIPAGTDYNNLPWVKEVELGWRQSYRIARKAKPMTRDEYAEWRLAVEREKQKELALASFNKSFHPAQPTLGD